MRGDRSSFPIRDTQRERASAGSSAVKTYKMSPEELEDYRAKNGYKAPTNSNGVAEKRGMDLRTKASVVTKEQFSAEQSRRAKMGHIIKEGPNKEVVLTGIAAGKTISAVERELGMKVNALHYWIRKWEWVGITPGKARAILSGEPIEEVIKVDDVKSDCVDPMPTAAVEAIAGYKERIAQLEAQNTEVVATSGKAIDQLQGKILYYEDELALWAQVDTEKQMRISELAEDRDQWRQQCMEARQAVRELEEERSLLLQTIESTVEGAVESVFVDNVNSPAHYTAGGIETIDFIVAKMTPEEFAGFCKGNTLKYVARANHKGGIEDLRKARWYVDKLIGENELG